MPVSDTIWAQKGLMRSNNFYKTLIINNLQFCEKKRKIALFGLTERKTDRPTNYITEQWAKGNIQKVTPNRLHISRLTCRVAFW